MNLHFPPLIYMFFLIFGTSVSVSSSSLIGMWMGLEINLMAFIPLIINLEYNKKSSESAIKYFLVQAIASSIVIFSSLISLIGNSFFISLSSNILFTIALCTKLGMAPFHFWFPEVLEGLSWVNSLIILTWQKVSPLIILSVLSHEDTLLVLALLSALVGAISGFNQSSVRKILAFSSISHLGWISSMMYFSSNVWIMYFLIYCLTSFILCVSFWFLNVNFLSQVVSLSSLNEKMIIFVNLLSLGGLPPLLGFLPKWIAMVTLSKNFPVLIFLLISSLITLYFYTRMCFSTFTLFNKNSAWNQSMISKKYINLLSVLTIFSIVGMAPLSFISF